MIEIEKLPEKIVLWLDDIRPMPQHFNLHAETANEAIMILKTGRVVEISFDHDLADDHYPQSDEDYAMYEDRSKTFQEGTGYTVAKALVEMVYNKEIDFPLWSCHTQNPVGRINMESILHCLEDVMNVVREKRRVDAIQQRANSEF